MKSETLTNVQLFQKNAFFRKFPFLRKYGTLCEVDKMFNKK